MPKKKGKKKREKQSNPHKLTEQQLKDKLHSFLSRQSVDKAYSLAKVLLERFESPANVSLFQSVLILKLKDLEAAGKSHEAPKLVAEAKKRFSNCLFQEIDEHVRLKNLGDLQILEHFSGKQEVPESFHHQIADILFFSQKPDRRFIKQHVEFKDVFYVKEAFHNGYDAIKTPKILSAIKAGSPYRLWHLLHKGIQAFLANDSESLTLIAKKLPKGYFPAFLVSKLVACQEYLDGKSEINSIDTNNLEIFKTLCGENVTLAILATSMANSQKKTSIYKQPSKLNWIKKNHPDQLGVILSLFLAETGNLTDNNSYQGIKNYRHILELIDRPEDLAIDRSHLHLKLSGFRLFNSYQLEDVYRQVLESIEKTKSPFFDAGRLKSEVLFHYVKSLDAPETRSTSIFDRLFDFNSSQSPDDESIPFLEEALEYSDHNPNMHTKLIEHHVAIKSKASIINKAVARFLTRFPTNPEGYNLAGKLAFQKKAYKKAVDFFSKAKELMPLNREITETVLDCYEGIIDKRNKSNHHLIPKDLDAALKYIDPKQTSLLDRYELLEIKALLKNLSLSQISLREFQKEFTKRYPSIPKDAKIALKLLLLIIQAQKTTQNLDQSLDFIKNQIQENLKPDIYRIFLHCAVIGENKVPPSFYTIMSDLTLHFVGQNKMHNTLTREQCVELMYLSIVNMWNNSFVALSCLASAAFPEFKVFLLIKNLLLVKVNQKTVKTLLQDEEVVTWFLTPSGKKFLRELADYNDVFDELYYFLKNSDSPHPKQVIQEINQLIEEIPNSFTNLASFLLDKCDSDDLLELHRIKDLFGIPIKTRAGAVFRPEVFLDDISDEEIERLQRLEEQEEREWEEEQKRIRDMKKKQQEMKRKAAEEMDTKNEQLDLFDLLDGEVSL